MPNFAEVYRISLRTLSLASCAFFVPGLRYNSWLKTVACLTATMKSTTFPFLLAATTYHVFGTLVPPLQ